MRHSQSQPFSDVTKAYLCRFYQILDDMIAGITQAELTDSISHNFIMQMIPHHRAAIEMSQNLLQYTTCVSLQHIAKNSIAEQTKSIENMRSILPRCRELTNSKQDLCLYEKGFRLITQTMFSQMRGACSNNNIHADFMREMIPHHQGAIRMSENVLHYSICPDLNPILQSIITSQKNGVREMEHLLQCLCH